MKVCHLIDHLGPGGAQRLVVDLLETRAESVRAEVLALRGNPLEALAGRVASCGGHYRTLSLDKWNPLGALRLRSALLRGACDVLHTHLEYANSFGIAAAASLGRRRPRIVCHVHADPLLHNSRLFHAFARSAARYVDAYIAPGPGVAGKIAGMLAPLRKRIVVVRPGIDLPALAAAPVDAGRVRALRAGAKRVIGFAGRLVAQKDLSVLIDAMPALLAEEPATRVLVIGDGPRRNAHEEHGRRLGVAHALTFTGHIADMADAYRAMDVLALPTRYEGLPLTLIEAMAARVPVAATAATGVTDLVTDGVTGLLTAPGDAEAMASALLRLFGEQALYESLQAAAFEMVHTQYSRQRMTAETEALYAELASGAAPNRSPPARPPSP